MNCNYMYDVFTYVHTLLVFAANYLSNLSTLRSRSAEIADDM